MLIVFPFEFQYWVVIGLDLFRLVNPFKENCMRCEFRMASGFDAPPPSQLLAGGAVHVLRLPALSQDVGMIHTELKGSSMFLGPH
jgi:hypothetical protein